MSIAGRGIVAAAFANAAVWRYRDGVGWQGLRAGEASALAVDAWMLAPSQLYGCV